MNLACLDYCSTATPSHAVVLLHGWGANAQDLASLAPHLDLQQLRFLLPNAPHPHPYSSEGRMWYDLETQEHLGDTRQLLRDWIESLPERLNLPLNQIILGGFSQGGAMTLDVGHDLPLAGLICLSGYLHPHIRFSANKAKPTLIIHGLQDPVVPIEAAQMIQSAMLNADWKPEVHQLQMAHEISAQALQLVRGFLLHVSREQ